MDSVVERSRRRRAFSGDGKIGSYEYIADVKVDHMTVDGLDSIMGESPKGLECYETALPEDQENSFPFRQGRKDEFRNSCWRPRPALQAYHSCL